MKPDVSVAPIVCNGIYDRGEETDTSISVSRIRSVCHSETSIHQLPQGRDGERRHQRHHLVRGSRRPEAVDILDPGGLSGANVPRQHVSKPLHRHGRRKLEYQGRRQERRRPLRVQRH